MDFLCHACSQKTENHNSLICISSRPLVRFRAATKTTVDNFEIRRNWTNRSYRFTYVASFRSRGSLNNNHSSMSLESFFALATLCHREEWGNHKTVARDTCNSTSAPFDKTIYWLDVCHQIFYLPPPSVQFSTFQLAPVTPIELLTCLSLSPSI